MNILVTGGAGYIGSVLVPMLLDRDHEVAVVDNFMYEQTPLLDHCISEKLHVVRGSVQDMGLMQELIQKADVILPLACLTGASLCQQRPSEAKETIITSLEMLLMLCKKQKIVYPTTNSGYGIGESGKFCTEESPLRPISLYGKYKMEAEKLVLQYQHSISLRLATVFGMSPRMRLDLLVNDFVYRAVTDRFIVLFEADFKRNFIHIRDVASAFLHCLDHFDAMKGHVYNLGLSDANLSKRELCEEIKKSVPQFYIHEDSIGEDPDKRDYIVSNEKIEKTGFCPNVSLHDGITELIKGYQIIRRKQFSNV